MKGNTSVLGVFTLIGLLSAPGALAEGAGWTLNLERSELTESTPVPQPLAAKAHLMLVSTGVAPRGREGELALNDGQLSYQSELRFSAKLDGRDYPLQGLQHGDSIAIALEDDNAIVSTIKSAGHKVASFKRTVGENARTMVITARYFDEAGRVAARERLIFERR